LFRIKDALHQIGFTAQHEVAMSRNARDDGRSRTGAPWFVVSCAIGFLIISGCVAYFLVRLFV
jgi:hypothetical protein